MRISLDTNVLVSAFATRGLSPDVLTLVLAEHELVLGEAVLTELSRILRTKLKVPAEAVEEIDAFLRTQAMVVGGAPVIDVPLRDLDDLPVLAQAIHRRADVLVTGDNDLLSVAGEAPIRILSPRGLWELLRVGPDQVQHRAHCTRPGEGQGGQVSTPVAS